MSVRTFTNTKASQSLNGASVVCTVQTDEVASMQWIRKDCPCENYSSGKLGVVYHVDYFGDSFQIVPIQMDKNFQSLNSGYLNDGETVIVRCPPSGDAEIRITQTEIIRITQNGDIRVTQ